MEKTCGNCEYSEPAAVVAEGKRETFDFCDIDGCVHPEPCFNWKKRKEELEEAKKCTACKWNAHEDVAGGWICTNEKSVHCYKYAVNIDGCEKWEEEE